MKLANPIRVVFRAGGLLAAALAITASIAHFVDLPSASAQVPPPVVPWTGVPSTGTVDESGINFFGFTGPKAHYRAGSASVSPLQFRYNVTNTFDNGANPKIPGWTSLEVGADAPNGSAVDAWLKRVEKCTGIETIVCQVHIDGVNACQRCIFAANAVDFTNNLYYVDVVLSRNAANINPVVKTIRITN